MQASTITSAPYIVDRGSARQTETPTQASSYSGGRMSSTRASSMSAPDAGHAGIDHNAQAASSIDAAAYLADIPSIHNAHLQQAELGAHLSGQINVVAPEDWYKPHGTWPPVVTGGTILVDTMVRYEMEFEQDYEEEEDEVAGDLVSQTGPDLPSIATTETRGWR